MFRGHVRNKFRVINKETMPTATNFTLDQEGGFLTIAEEQLPITA